MRRMSYRGRRRKSITVQGSRLPKTISIPQKAEYGQFGLWWVNSSGYEFEHKGRIWRHYCIEKLPSRSAQPTGTAGPPAHNAVVTLIGDNWRGVVVSDEFYYRKGMTAKQLADMALKRLNL